MYFCQLQEPGPCKHFVDRWFFNAEDGTCHPFKYGGCAGNRNHFFTQNECEIHCARFLRKFHWFLQRVSPADSALLSKVAPRTVPYQALFVKGLGRSYGFQNVCRSKPRSHSHQEWRWRSHRDLRIVVTTNHTAVACFSLCLLSAYSYSLSLATLCMKLSHDMITFRSSP